jgi:hypothetical protein
LGEDADAWEARDIQSFADRFSGGRGHTDKGLSQNETAPYHAWTWVTVHGRKTLVKKIDERRARGYNTELLQE